jgi:hypothetical protein
MEFWGGNWPEVKPSHVIKSRFAENEDDWLKN